MNASDRIRNPDQVLLHGNGYTAEAGWFGPDDRPRFGWLYRPGAPTGDVGVVIVPPFGSEEMRAHRTLRHLAEDCAGAGLLAVRFDLDGTGNSAGDDCDPDRLGAWIASVRDACSLARAAGARRIVLVGVRLGATLATLAAMQETDVAALVAFNAVVRGKAYLRELRAFQLAMNLPPGPETASADGQECSGFMFTDETCAALKAIDLATLATAPCPRVLLLERDDLAPRKPWPDHLRTLGVEVDERNIPGYEAMMDHPHATRVAQAFIDACIECAQGSAAATRDGVVHTAPLLQPRIRTQIGGVPIIEEVVSPETGMFGVLTGPTAGVADRGLLTLNVGANHHIGSNRSDVPLARQLAAAGVQVLRVDLTGIGDSQPRSGTDENVVYGPNALPDIAAAVAMLRARGARHVTVGGMCSGGYHALRTAIAGQPVDAVYAVNCSVFGQHVDFDPLAGSLLGQVAHYNRSVKSAQAWRKLLSGRVAFSSIARVATWHVRKRGRRLWHEVARFLHVPLADDLGTHLRRLAQRKVTVHFLYAGNEPGLTLLTSEAGSVLPRLTRAGWIHTRIFEGTDHTFTQRWAQAQLHETITEIMRSDEQVPT